MNSVMEIGEKIVYIHEGRKWWEGTKVRIHPGTPTTPQLNDFVFAFGDGQTGQDGGEVGRNRIPKKI